MDRDLGIQRALLVTAQYLISREMLTSVAILAVNMSRLGQRSLSLPQGGATWCGNDGL